MPPQHRHHRHHHGVMGGWIVRPYDWFVAGIVMRGSYRRIAEGVTVGVPDGGRVVDIGTGPGRLVEAIARRRPGLDVIGVDPSDDMLLRARTRTARLPQARVLRGAAENLPFADDSVDAVVSSLSSHHWTDTAEALAEQSRVLRPGGRLWVVDLRNHLDEDIGDEITAAGLRLSDDDLGLRGPVGHRLVVLAARKPLAAA